MTNNTETEYYLYDREDRIGDYDENGNLIIAYTHGPGIDEPVAMTVNGSTYFYIPDIQGSIRAIADINGNLMASYVYDVWGNLISHGGVLSERNDYLYTGREYDWETGIYYYRYRYYNPEIGRFMQSSWELNEEMNMYVYVNNDPVKGTDPTGHPDVGGGNLLTHQLRLCEKECSCNKPNISCNIWDRMWGFNKACFETCRLWLYIGFLMPWPGIGSGKGRPGPGPGTSAFPV